jgi:hypothetical protein
MILYLSGPMSGIALHNRPAFDEAASTLRAQGHVVLNPHEISPPDGRTWEAALRADLLAMLQRADGIVLLPHWRCSRGARLEHHVAKELSFAFYVYTDGGVLV